MDLANSAIMLSLVPNFYLEWDAYTAEASQLQPFLHLWSLGVEEQFYLFAVDYLVWKQVIIAVVGIGLLFCLRLRALRKFIPTNDVFSFAIQAV